MPAHIFRRRLVAFSLAFSSACAAFPFVACSDPAGEAKASAAALASDDGGSAPVTPIALASAWVDGFYDGGARGVNTYDNTNVRGVVGVDGAEGAISSSSPVRNRVFVDASGTIAGFSQSPNTESVYHPRPDPLPLDDGFPSSTDIVFGRYEAPSSGAHGEVR